MLIRHNNVQIDVPELRTPLRLELEDEHGENHRPIWSLVSSLLWIGPAPRFPERFQDCQMNILVPKGFYTDLASVPRAPLVYLIAGGRGNIAAVFHDYLCQKRPYPFCSKLTHKVFHHILLRTGHDETIARDMYEAVKAFGPRWELSECQKT